MITPNFDRPEVVRVFDRDLEDQVFARAEAVKVFDREFETRVFDRDKEEGDG